MKIIKEGEFKFEYKATCCKCNTQLEATSWELYDPCELTNTKRGKCPICSEKISFKKK